MIALTAADAAAAQAGGADRVELATDMAADGLTPDPRVVRAVRGEVDLPVRVMLRERDGFGAGGPAALAKLADQVGELRAAGAEAFVLGFLDDAGAVDLAAIRTLLTAAGDLTWTFHRAIDHAADRHALRKEVAQLPGLDTILTAGSPAGVADGLPVLAAEAARSASGEPAYRARLLVGGGLRLSHVPTLRAAGVDAFHIGGAARPDGWDAPVDAAAVRRWRLAVDDPGSQAPSLGGPG